MPWGWAFFNYPIRDGQFRGDDIVVAPEGMTKGSGDSFNFVQGKPDGEQIVDLIKLFKKHYPIGQVYLYGHSQGAFFCYWFAGEHPELVDGIVAKALKGLSKPSKKSIAGGVNALERSFLAPSLDELRIALDHAASSPPKGTDEPLAEYAALLTARTAIDAEGESKVAARTKELVDAFFVEHPAMKLTGDAP